MAPRSRRAAGALPDLQVSDLFEADPSADAGPGQAGTSTAPRAHDTDGDADPRPLPPAEPDARTLDLAARRPAGLYVGTSSWSFPGWAGAGLVYGRTASETRLSRAGLTAYGRHPLLGAVGIDRGFYRPLAEDEYVAYARQVPAGFRFLVKAPAEVTDAVLRGPRGVPLGPNPHFLDPALAAERFVVPALRGLGDAAGPLVFQLSPLPQALLRPDALPALVARLGAFLQALPRSVDGRVPLLAVEPRDAGLLTPRFVRMLADAGTRLCVGVHPQLPPVARQAAALALLDGLDRDDPAAPLRGPLVVRWSLNPSTGLRYEAAKAQYAPFDRLVDPDPGTRAALATLAGRALAGGNAAFVIVNNKAEGSAPRSCTALVEAVLDALPAAWRPDDPAPQR